LLAQGIDTEIKPLAKLLKPSWKRRPTEARLLLWLKGFASGFIVVESPTRQHKL
jgi:hypothetical protein